MRIPLPLLLVASLSLVACGAILTPPTGSDAVSSVSTSSALSQDIPGTVEYGTLEGMALKGYLAVPDTPGPHPALILIHQWWGLTNSMRDMADNFADEGYVVLAVDLYDGHSTTDVTEAGTMAGTVRNNPERAMHNLQKAVAFLKERSDVEKSHIASVGWCFGGGWAYQMAKNDLGVKATVMYYGQFDPHDDFEHMRADILGHFGEKDTSISVDSVREFQAALKTHKGVHEVYIYPNVGHGFANPENTAAYNEEAAGIAWQRTLAFLSKTLHDQNTVSSSSRAGVQ